jgi:hypothetical protein
MESKKSSFALFSSSDLSKTTSLSSSKGLLSLEGLPKQGEPLNPFLKKKDIPTFKNFKENESPNCFFPVRVRSLLSFNESELKDCSFSSEALEKRGSSRLLTFDSKLTSLTLDFSEKKVEPVGSPRKSHQKSAQKPGPKNKIKITTFSAQLEDPFLPETAQPHSALNRATLSENQIFCPNMQRFASHDMGDFDQINERQQPILPFKNHSKHDQVKTVSAELVFQVSVVNSW